jgi:hypothetical protein
VSNCSQKNVHKKTTKKRKHQKEEMITSKNKRITENFGNELVSM